MTHMFSKKLTGIASIIAVTLLASVPVSADTSSQGGTWTAADYGLTHIGSEFTKKRAELVQKNELIYTVNTSEPGLLLSCSNNKLGAIVSMGSQDWTKTIKKKSSRNRVKQVTMRLDDGDGMDVGTFVYKPHMQILVARSPRQAKKLYNAVVKGQKVSLKISAKDAVVFTPPKPNGMFADFGSQCKVGRHK